MSQNLDYKNVVFDKTRYIISAVGVDKGIYVGEVSSHTKLFDIDANSSIDELLKNTNQESLVIQMFCLQFGYYGVTSLKERRENNASL